MDDAVNDGDKERRKVSSSRLAAVVRWDNNATTDDMRNKKQSSGLAESQGKALTSEHWNQHQHYSRGPSTLVLERLIPAQRFHTAVQQVRKSMPVRGGCHLKKIRMPSSKEQSFVR